MALAAIAFIWCIFSGAESMLWWIPRDMGGIEEDGGYTSLRTLLASFVAFAGLFLLQFIETASHEKNRLKRALERISQLEKALQNSGDSLPKH